MDASHCPHGARMARPDVRTVSISLARISFEMRGTGTNRERRNHADFDANCTRRDHDELPRRGNSYRLQMKCGSMDVKQAGSKSSQSCSHSTTNCVPHENRSDDAMSPGSCSG